MNRRPHFAVFLLSIASALAGCDYASKKPKPLPTTIVAGPLPNSGGQRETPPPTDVTTNPDPEPTTEGSERDKIILESVVKLIDNAYKKPGGKNIDIAIENLNDLFEGSRYANQFNLSPASREFLMRAIYQMTGKDPEPQVKVFLSKKFTTRDARHIEDCMLYHSVAIRVAGEGDNLTRVRRIFAWVVRNVLLVPPQSLSGNGLNQAQARPADVLVRGMAVETQEGWSERGWVFMALCRQIGVDVGLLTYSPKLPLMIDRSVSRGPMPWICAAIVDDKPYLFDPRIGLEIPSPDGKGVATLDQVINDPLILERLNLPGQFNYGTTAADLANSTTRISVMIDSSRGLLCPKMRTLQGQLRGENRTTLFRDPAEQFAAFAKALGSRFGGVSLWGLPLFVEESLFNDNKFTESTKMSLTFFDNKLPLVYARTAQLRGDMTEAMSQYVGLRFAEHAKMKNPEETPIPPELQHILDVYSTYFLAECHRDQGDLDKAEYLYLKTLDLVPEPGPGRYYYYFFRWGAQANLARIYEDKGQTDRAIAYYTQSDRTPQAQGNHLRARDLVWKNPFAEPAPTLPPAPNPPEIENPVKPANN